MWVPGGDGKGVRLEFAGVRVVLRGDDDGMMAVDGCAKGDGSGSGVEKGMPEEKMKKKIRRRGFDRD